MPDTTGTARRHFDIRHRATFRLALVFAVGLNACKVQMPAPTLEFRGATCETGSKRDEPGITCSASLVAVGASALSDTSIFVGVEEITRSGIVSTGPAFSFRVDTIVYLVQLSRGVARLENGFENLFACDSMVKTFRLLGYVRDTMPALNTAVRLEARVLRSLVDSTRFRSLGRLKHTVQLLAVGAPEATVPPIFAQVRAVRWPVAPLVVDTTSDDGKVLAMDASYWHGDTTVTSVLVNRGIGTIEIIDPERDSIGPLRELRVVLQAALSPLPPLSVTVHGRRV